MAACSPMSKLPFWKTSSLIALFLLPRLKTYSMVVVTNSLVNNKLVVLIARVRLYTKTCEVEIEQKIKLN